MRYLGLGTQSGQYGAAGGMRTIDYIEAEDLLCDGEGNFTILLSAERGDDPGNWLRLAPDVESAMFIVRQTFGDRSRESPAELSIECVHGSSTPSPLTPEKLDDALLSAGLFVAGASMMFAKWAAEFQSHANQLPLFDQARSDKAGGDPKIRYFHSYWRLPLGLVMRIRVEEIPCKMWNFQVRDQNIRARIAEKWL